VRKIGHCLLLVVLLFPFWSAQGSSELSHITIARGELPFTLLDGYLMVVHARINDNFSCRLAIDTGATHSLLDLKLVRKLGLTPRPGRVFSLDRIVATEWVDVNELEAGPVSAAQFSMQAADLSYLNSVGTVDGIIGLDVLRNSDFDVDYKAHKIRFDSGSQSSSHVPMHAGPLFLSVELKIADQSVRVLLDSGIPGLLLYEDRVGAQVTDRRTLAWADARSLGNRISARHVTIPRVRLGGTDLERTAMLVNGPAPNTLPQIDGYLGLSTLKVNHVAFNFRQNTFSWK